MGDLGKLLVLAGGLLVIFGLILLLAGRIGLPFGRLPGDIVYAARTPRSTFPSSPPSC